MTSSFKKYNNLTQRIITGVLGSAAVIAGVCISEWTYFAVFFTICLFSLIEFYKLASRDNMMPEQWIGIATGVLLFVLSFLIELEKISYRTYFILFPIIALVFIIKLYKANEKKPFINIALTLLGIVYIALPFALLNIGVMERGKYHYEIIFGCLFILWASDTGAYFAGTYLGKRKLFERISPKKSWEGFFGGALLALVFTFGLAHFFDLLSLADWIAIEIIIIVGGTFGDLVESMLKRSIEIKDSGDALPGHGGFLDRFDGLFISAPFIVAYLELTRAI